MKKLKLFSIAIFLILAIIWSVSTGKVDNKNSEVDLPDEAASIEETTPKEEYPITDAWVYRYNAETGKGDFAPCGYIDEYTSIVEDADESPSNIITSSYMYLGTIIGYQNEDRTIQVYQVELPEISDNFVLTNDAIELDYSGNRKMIEVAGWIYMGGTTILAVSPLYSD